MSPGPDLGRAGVRLLQGGEAQWMSQLITAEGGTLPQAPGRGTLPPDPAHLMCQVTRCSGLASGSWLPWAEGAIGSVPQEQAGKAPLVEGLCHFWG